MDTLMWRIWAKLVAIIDIVILCLVMLGIILMAAIVSLGFTISDTPDTMEEFSKQGISDEDAKNAKYWSYTALLSTPAWIMWVIVVVFLVFNGIQMWAAITLLGSAKLGGEPAAALGKARFWRNVTIVFFLLSLSGGIICWGIILLLVLWRGPAFIVVYKFMKELESIITCQSGGVNSSSLNGVDNK